MLVNNWLLFHVGFLISFLQRISFLNGKAQSYICHCIIMIGAHFSQMLCYWIAYFDITYLIDRLCYTAKDPEYVTCGSVLKLYNIDYKVRLHSHDVKYGSGSGQQSVTGIAIPEDLNSHWAIKAPTGENCVRG